MEKDELLKNLTGYPSVDRPWLKYYKPGAEERANNIPKNKTIWDIIEEKLLEYYEYPALEYFGRKFSKQEFIDLCYIWGRTFRALGVEKDEMIPIYGPFVPDVCAMLFGLNMIGAHPYFLKLAISPTALAEETKDSKIAVVFDGMWQNVAHEFMKDKYKNIIISSAPLDMPFPMKQIVELKNRIEFRKNKTQIPDDKRFIWSDKAREMANYYSGDVKVPFEANRTAVVTSSSGTTIGGIVKGVMATNESILAQIQCGVQSDIHFFPGNRILNHFPPTASTSLNTLFLTGIYTGETIIIDPRVSEKDFYNQLTKLKPNIAVSTGSAWELFFNRIEREMNQGKKFDFDFTYGWTIGGEGTDVKKFAKWKEIMEKCHCNIQLVSGYGLSEVFSSVGVEHLDAPEDLSKPIITVGIPYAGMIAGVFDKDGNELSYNQRGELRIKSKAMMKGYYGKPELTNETIEDGWLKTGDLAEINDDGLLFIWGRTKDSIKVNDKDVYLFDIANLIRSKEYIKDVMVLQKPTGNNAYNLVAHIVWEDSVKEDYKSIYIEELDQLLKSYLPKPLELTTFAEHEIMLPYSTTTLKKDKNKMSKQNDGYVQLIDGTLTDVEFVVKDDGTYDIEPVTKEHVKKLTKKKN